MPESSVHPGCAASPGGDTAAPADPDTNTPDNPASFSYCVAQVIKPFVVIRKAVTDEEAAEWLDDFASLEESRAYFFSLTPVLTEAAKVA